MLSNVLPPDEVASGYSVSVYDGETRIYERTTRPGEEPNDWAQQVTVDLYGATWTAHVWPTTAHLQATADPLTELILLSGLGLSWLLGLAVYLVQTAQLRAREAEQVSALLREEIAIRRETEGALTRQARELARSNADLEQFAYVASHDLQEPLRMVASYLQLLERRYRPQLDRDAVEFIDYAVDGANRMRALINDLLAYSRVGTRGKPFEPCDMNAVLARALANLEVAIQEHHASVTAGELPTVPGDRTQLTQLFQNLIANAVKFRSEEPPRIEVSAERDESGWRFAVRDNGIGIAPEHASRVFLVFQRLHTRSEYEGTGIGLAICKKIVERHGGRIWVDSIPGKGSVFMFTLPNQAPRYDEQS
ncbi:MAG: hypothetical protein HUU35_10565 [Armatimonadetes bacterium]|nr:hypothetical protein [Armatimonadota bacterium]